jgi:hypothetical protein
VSAMQKEVRDFLLQRPALDRTGFGCDLHGLDAMPCIPERELPRPAALTR